MFIGCFKLAICAGKTDLGSLFHCSLPRSETQGIDRRDSSIQEYEVKPRPFRVSYTRLQTTQTKRHVMHCTLFPNVLALAIF